MHNPVRKGYHTQLTEVLNKVGIVVLEKGRCEYFPIHQSLHSMVSSVATCVFYTRLGAKPSVEESGEENN